MAPENRDDEDQQRERWHIRDDIGSALDDGVGRSTGEATEDAERGADQRRKERRERRDEQGYREPVEKTLPQISPQAVCPHDAEDRPAESYLHWRELVLRIRHDNLHVDPVVTVQRVDAPGAITGGNTKERPSQDRLDAAWRGYPRILLGIEAREGVGGRRLVGERNPLRDVIKATIRRGLTRARTAHGDASETNRTAVRSGQADQNGRGSGLEGQPVERQNQRRRCPVISEGDRGLIDADLSGRYGPRL